jgi:hypothetical protein
MIGTHKVEDYVQWLKNKDDFPVISKVGLIKKCRENADMASKTGKMTILEIKRQRDVVMKLMFFPDGSLSVGYPDDVKWAGGAPVPSLFPTDKELV